MERRSAAVSKESQLFLERMARTKPKNLDNLVQTLHIEAFEKIDCLECVRCCSSLGPQLFESDIDRMAGALKQKSSVFKDNYVRIDDEGDSIFKQSPCPFLCDDKLCSIYTNRPKACREYPHTDQKRFYQVARKTFHNASVCPAVYSILESLKKML